MDDAAKRVWRDTWDLWLAMLTAVVVLTLVAVWHADRSAWYDEAWVIEYLDAPTPLATLDLCVANHRPMAWGYAWMMWPVGHTAGDALWAYRVPSALFAALLALATGILVLQWSEVRALGVVAVIFLLSSPFLQRYATEIKQYMPEAALSVTLILLTQWWSRCGRRAAAIAWLIVALLTLLLTFSGWFVVAACGLVIALRWLRPLRKSQLVTTLIFGAIIAALAAALHLGYSRHIATGSFEASWAEEFVPFDRHWPGAIFNRLVEMQRRAWVSYDIPAKAMIASAAVGWLVWLRRQPVAALAAGLSIGITLAANVAGVWPLGIGARARVNLPLIVLLNLCMLALPLGLIGFLTDALRRRVPDTPRPRLVMEWAGFVLCLLLAAFVLRESSAADYEVAQVRLLLREVAQQARGEDLVILEETSAVQLRFDGPAVPGRVLRAPWPAPETVLTDYMPLATQPGYSRVWLAAGHHNDALASTWQSLGEALSTRGRWRQVWQGRLVALYLFEPSE